MAYSITIVAYQRTRPEPKHTIEMAHLEQYAEEWDLLPFTDIVLTTETFCPETHPSEVLYSVWPGVTQACDCLGRNGEIFPNIKCDKGHEDAAHNDKDCWDEAPAAPIVMAQIDGARVCGRRGG